MSLKKYPNLPTNHMSLKKYYNLPTNHMSLKKYYNLPTINPIYGTFNLYLPYAFFSACVLFI